MLDLQKLKNQVIEISLFGTDSDNFEFLAKINGLIDAEMEKKKVQEWKKSKKEKNEAI